MKNQRRCWADLSNELDKALASTHLRPQLCLHPIFVDSEALRTEDFLGLPPPNRAGVGCFKFPQRPWCCRAFAAT